MRREGRWREGEGGWKDREGGRGWRRRASPSREAFLVFRESHTDYWFPIGFDWFFSGSHRFP